MLIMGKMIVNALAHDKYAEELDKTFENIGKNQAIEGKKSGYERAAKEYEKVYADLEKRYIQVIEELEKNSFFSTKRNSLAKALESLENKEKDLMNQINVQINEASKQSKVPGNKIKELLKSKASIANPGMLEILAILSIYNKGKEIQYIRAEQKGYEEAKREHTAKIKQLEYKLESLKGRISEKNRKAFLLAESLLHAIATQYTTIAELKIILAKGE